MSTLKKFFVYHHTTQNLSNVKYGSLKPWFGLTTNIEKLYNVQKSLFCTFLYVYLFTTPSCM